MSFRRWLAVIGLFLAAAFCGLLAGLLHFAGSGLDQTLEIAARAPTRTLAEVLTTDGVAWVKIRLEVASGTVPLRCAGQACLFVEVEEFQTRMEDFRSGGTWTRRPFERSIRSERKVVPFDLVDGPTRLAIRDALGIKFWPDLLQERHSTGEASGQGLVTGRGLAVDLATGQGTSMASGSATDLATGQAQAMASGSATDLATGRGMDLRSGPGKAGLPGQENGHEMGHGSGLGGTSAEEPGVDGGMGGRRVESFLPDGTEAWALGSFRNGTPQVLDSGMFVLTSLGPQRFGKTVHAGLSRVGKVQGWCAAGAVLFPLVALVLILKRR